MGNKTYIIALKDSESGRKFSTMSFYDDHEKANEFVSRYNRNTAKSRNHEMYVVDCDDEKAISELEDYDLLGLD